MKRRRQQGFTLLEVMAALSIFLIGVVGVISLFTSGTKLHQDAENRSRVLDLQGALLLRVERELAAAVQEMPEEGIEAGRQPLPGADGFEYSYRVRTARGFPPYLLELEVWWQEGGRWVSQTTRQVLAEKDPPADLVRRALQRSQ